MLSTYPPCKLLTYWKKEELTLEQAMGHTIQNLKQMEQIQQLNERNIMRQQRVIEQLSADIKRLEEVLAQLREQYGDLLAEIAEGDDDAA